MHLLKGFSHTRTVAPSVSPRCRCTSRSLFCACQYSTRSLAAAASCRRHVAAVAAAAAAALFDNLAALLLAGLPLLSNALDLAAAPHGVASRFAARQQRNVSRANTLEPIASGEKAVLSMC